MTIVNAHRVLHDSPSGNDFLRAITPAEKTEDRLRAAREEIRRTLREAIQNWSRFVKREEWSVQRERVLPQVTLRPMFRLQGSFAYRTLNDPARKPPQELDLDDGMFLPVSFIAANGARHPSILSRGLFRVVELALQPLCDDRKWVLDTSKASCIRIKVTAHSHIDLALYSIPDQEFAELSKSLLAKRAQSKVQQQTAALELDEELYFGIASEQIMLAHRVEGWKPSDPRKLELWFASAIERHGSLVRRMCRYLKAWRDHHWASCKLSSIALMACVVDMLDGSKKSPAANRDDLALEMIAHELHARLLERIDNPVVLGQPLDEGWSDEMRRDYSAKAQVLAQSLTTALHGSTTATGVIALLRGVLGPRIPDDASLVRIEDETPARHSELSGAPAVLTTGLLRERASPPEVRAAVQKAGERRYA